MPGPYWVHGPFAAFPIIFEAKEELHFITVVHNFFVTPIKVLFQIVNDELIKMYHQGRKWYGMQIEGS